MFLEVKFLHHTTTFYNILNVTFLPILLLKGHKSNRELAKFEIVCPVVIPARGISDEIPNCKDRICLLRYLAHLNSTALGPLVSLCFRIRAH